MRTSAAIAPCSEANTGFRSISEISGKSATNADTRSIMRGQGGAVNGPGAANAAQDFCRSDAVQHRERVLRGSGREPEGDVLQHLHQYAAEAERHQLAERRVRDRADDDLLAAGQHLLHLHAEDFGSRRRICARCR